MRNSCQHLQPVLLRLVDCNNRLADRVPLQRRRGLGFGLHQRPHAGSVFAFDQGRQPAVMMAVNSRYSAHQLLCGTGASAALSEEASSTTPMYPAPRSTPNASVSATTAGPRRR